MATQRKCRGCGSEYSIEEEGSGKCPYCGTVLESSLINSSLDEIMSNARGLRRIGNFKAARKEYNRVIEENAQIREAHFGLFLCDYGVKEYRLKGSEVEYCICTSCSKMPAGQNESLQEALNGSANIDIWRKVMLNIEKQRRLNVKIQKSIPSFSAILLCDPNNEQDNETAKQLYDALKDKMDIFYPRCTLANIDPLLWANYLQVAIKDTNALLVISSESASKLQNSTISTFYKDFRDAHNDYQTIPIVPDPSILPKDMFDDPEEAEYVEYDPYDLDMKSLVSDVIEQIKAASWTFSEKSAFRRDGKLFFNDTDESPVLEPLAEE